MTYTAEALQEYPVQIDDGVAEGDDGEITFLREPINDGVTPPPTPASWHVEENVENVQYMSRIHIRKRNVAEKRSVEAAQSLGYILPAPGEIGFSDIAVPEDAPDWQVRLSSATHNTQYIKHSENPPDTGLEHQTFHVNVQWAVDVPAGYSVLVTDPFFTRQDSFSIVPYVIDCDTGLNWITVTLLIHDTGFRIQFGDPLLQVIPFKRDSLRLDAVIDRTPPSEQE